MTAKDLIFPAADILPEVGLPPEKSK